MTKVGLSALADARYDGELLAGEIGELVAVWSLSADRRRGAVLGTQALIGELDGLAGETLQERFVAFEREVWPRWRAGGHGAPPYRWSAGVRAVVIARAVRPGWQGVMPAIATPSRRSQRSRHCTGSSRYRQQTHCMPSTRG